MWKGGLLRRFAPRNDGGHGHALASISTTIFPVVTCSPSATSMAEIVPAIGATCTCSIFMASRVITGWAAATRSPTLTRTATTRPFIAAAPLPFAAACRCRRGRGKSEIADRDRDAAAQEVEPIAIAEEF